jgi:hypothetical protein
MNLSTSNSKVGKVIIVRPLLATFSFLSLYQILIFTNLVKPNNGMHQWQNNLIRQQRYAYQDYSNLNLVLVGSSRTNNLPTSDISSSVINLGMSGGCAQTGIEVVDRKSSKPVILLIEINETITRKVDERVIGSIYNPFLYKLRLYIPMLREEYQPVITIYPKVISLVNKLINASGLTKKSKEIKPVVNLDKNLTNTLINKVITSHNTPLQDDKRTLLIQEAEYIKLRIIQLRKDGVRVVLFDIPREPRIQATIAEKQTQALMKEVFPANHFEWLPEPPPRDWKTLDGEHLVSSDAKDYVAFLKKQLLTKKVIMSKAASLSPILNSH